MIGFALLIAVIFGVTVSSGEFRHSTATITYVAFPNRTHVLRAKLTVAAGVGLVFGALGFTASTAVALIYTAADHYHIALSASTILGDAGGAILAGGLLSSMGVALGTLIRAQLAVVIGAFIWVVFAESILGGVYNQIGAPTSRSPPPPRSPAQSSVEADSDSPVAQPPPSCPSSPQSP